MLVGAPGSGPPAAWRYRARSLGTIALGDHRSEERLSGREG
jgi:hypothetical protein